MYNSIVCCIYFYINVCSTIYIYLIHISIGMKLDTRKTLSVLMEEIESVGEENLYLNVIVTITSTNNTNTNNANIMNMSTNDSNITIGIARIPLYTMIENNCNIIRHVSY